MHPVPASSSKNETDSHQKCYFFCDVDEKRNGFLIVLCVSLKNDKEFHRTCYLLSDFDEKRNGILKTLFRFLRFQTRIIFKITHVGSISIKKT